VTPVKRPRAKAQRPPLTHDLHPERRLTRPEVCELGGFCPATLGRMIRAGKWPAPEKYGPRMARWRAGTVLELIRARAQAATVAR